ncbi:unnamed protein product [Meloidogyne enterolobii]|uniref:Uncharacterized protein n=1 Tax=Meloidogyne enterolobii TaxID=390850 RepID=A0ACB0ZDY6_MELEN
MFPEHFRKTFSNKVLIRFRKLLKLILEKINDHPSGKHFFELEKIHFLLFSGRFINSCVFSNKLKNPKIKLKKLNFKSCSTDPLIVDDPEYEKENLVAYARARVFSLRPESHFLRFSCKLSLCLRQNDGCLGLTPPSCPPTNASRIPSHHHPSEKAPAALSQHLLSPQLTVNSGSSTATTSSTPPRLPFHGSAASFGGTGKSSLVDSAWTIGLVLGVSVLLGLFFGLATFLIQSHHRRNRQKRLVQWVG